jgi:hypothetical protein
MAHSAAFECKKLGCTTVAKKHGILHTGVVGCNDRQAISLHAKCFVVVLLEFVKGYSPNKMNSLSGSAPSRLPWEHLEWFSHAFD